jgi:hypothetical protein
MPLPAVRRMTPGQAAAIKSCSDYHSRGRSAGGFVRAYRQLPKLGRRKPLDLADEDRSRVLWIFPTGNIQKCRLTPQVRCRASGKRSADDEKQQYLNRSCVWQVERQVVLLRTRRAYRRQVAEIAVAASEPSQTAFAGALRLRGSDLGNNR